MRPYFNSDRYQFTVVMPNLNYALKADVPQDVPRNEISSQNSIDHLIISLIKKDNKISAEKMAMTLGVSAKTVKRHIKNIDVIQFVGRGANGHWEIREDEK